MEVDGKATSDVQSLALAVVERTGGTRKRIDHGFAIMITLGRREIVVRAPRHRANLC